MKEKILALLENEAFRAELEKLGSAEEILAAFKAKGVEVTAEDLQALVGGFGELDLDELDNVSGGAVKFLPISPSASTNTVAKWLLKKLIKK